jgi:hypothetical protein
VLSGTGKGTVMQNSQAAYDRLANAIIDFEDMLRAIHCPVPVSVTITHPGARDLVLSFRREDGSGPYSIHIETEPQKWLLLLNTKAETKVAMLQHLPTLEKAVVKCANEWAAKINTEVDKFLSQFDKPFKEQG